MLFFVHFSVVPACTYASISVTRCLFCPYPSVHSSAHGCLHSVCPTQTHPPCTAPPHSCRLTRPFRMHSLNAQVSIDVVTCTQPAHCVCRHTFPHTLMLFVSPWCSLSCPLPGIYFVCSTPISFELPFSCCVRFFPSTFAEIVVVHSACACVSCIASDGRHCRLGRELTASFCPVAR